MHTKTPGFLQIGHPNSPLNWLQFNIPAFAGRSSTTHNNLAFIFFLPLPGISISIPINNNKLHIIAS